MLRRTRLKVKYKPGHYYVDIDLTKSDADVDHQLKQLGQLLDWSEEEKTAPQPDPEAR